MRAAMMNDIQPVSVSSATKPTGEAHVLEWEWVERSIWTDRMLEALAKGVKGNVWYSLMDKVMRNSTLQLAWQKVKANQGSAGTDHQSLREFERNLAKNLEKLSGELGADTYHPCPIRRVLIDKPGLTEERPLGIPAVRDRVVQTALLLTIEPIFENVFAPQSYGFRPGLGCKDALRQVDQLLKQGCHWVVDADLKSYFDSIPHDRLMKEVRKYIADGRVLGLLQKYLKQEIFDGLNRWQPGEGTPQGAVISPLLSNLYLHSLDVAMDEAGYQMIRYADDVVILCRSLEGAEVALARLQKLLDERGLSLNPQKTRIADLSEPGDGFNFLGYHFTRGQISGRISRWPRKKSLKKLKDTIRQKTKRNNGQSLSVVIEQVNRTLRGWFEYFKHSHRYTFKPLDKWVRRRLRNILRKRSKLKGPSCGLDHHRWPNKYFQDLGLYSLVAAHGALFQSS
jgi:RNA-directed DNA polymerase